MLNADLPVFALGFRTGKMYHTLDVSLRADADANIPGDLLSFMKLGASDGKTSWDISNIGGRLDARAELAYGISRRFGRNLSVGARFKGIFYFNRYASKYKTATIIRRKANHCN